MDVEIKSCRKLFTKNKKSYKINTRDNPSMVNKINLQRKGLLMNRSTDEITLNYIKERLNWKEKIIVRIHKKTFNKVANLVRINTVNNLLK